MEIGTVTKQVISRGSKGAIKTAQVVYKTFLGKAGYSSRTRHEWYNSNGSIMSRKAPQS